MKITFIFPLLLLACIQVQCQQTKKEHATAPAVKIVFQGQPRTEKEYEISTEKDILLPFNNLVVDAAYPFSEGRALVNINEQYHYIDTNGNLLPFKFKRTSEMPGSFRQGRAKIYSRREKYGFIDLSGKLVIDTIYSYVHDYFSESLAFVVRNGFRGFIDRDGKEVMPIDKKYHIIFPFGYNIAIVSDMKKFGAINKKGQQVIPLEFADIEEFQEGFARAKKTEDGPWGLIDTKGNFVIEPKHPELSNVSEGLVSYKDEHTQRYGFLDTAGNVKIKPIFQYADDFSNGLAAVSNDDYKEGYIDKEGKLVIDFRFKETSGFSEGLAVASIEVTDSTRNYTRPQYGYINTNGEWVFPPIYDLAMNFSEGKALIFKKKWSYIQRK